MKTIKLKRRLAMAFPLLLLPLMAGCSSSGPTTFEIDLDFANLESLPIPGGGGTDYAVPYLYNGGKIGFDLASYPSEVPFLIPGDKMKVEHTGSMSKSAGDPAVYSCTGEITGVTYAYTEVDEYPKESFAYDKAGKLIGIDGCTIKDQYVIRGRVQSLNEDDLYLLCLPLSEFTGASLYGSFDARSGLDYGDLPSPFPIGALFSYDPRSAE